MAIREGGGLKRDEVYYILLTHKIYAQSFVWSIYLEDVLECDQKQEICLCHIFSEVYV
jgi:hypothetical protein